MRFPLEASFVSPQISVCQRQQKTIGNRGLRPVKSDLNLNRFGRVMNNLSLKAWRSTVCCGPNLRQCVPRISGAGSRRAQCRESSTGVATCPHLADSEEASAPRIHSTSEWQNALPYNQIPGPKPIPILGNTWR